jgi:hypothetical protein
VIFTAKKGETTLKNVCSPSFFVVVGILDPGYEIRKGKNPDPGSTSRIATLLNPSSF